MKSNAILINKRDNVVIALTDIKAGETVLLHDGRHFPAQCDIAFSHKILIAHLSAGEKLIKYGEVIGLAAEEIQTGEWVHTHNITFEVEKKI